MKIRIKFSKKGAVKFIGHLDIMRYFQKAIRRADVDICYSEGFSPHQIMSFASPLGVGLSSSGEYFDIEVASTQDSDTMVARLNDAMAEGITVHSFKKLPDRAQNAMSIVAAADYTLTFRNEYKPCCLDEFFKDLELFYSQESIIINKKTKKSEKEMDIKPLILSLCREGDSILMRTASGSAANLKPELAMEAFYRFQGKELSPFTFQIQREEVYGLSGDGLSYIPLEDFGENIE